MKTNLILTVYNEEETIKKYLDSIKSQTKKPDEIIIIDGGSTDKTVEIIKNYKKKSFPIKLIIEKGATIPKGRNIGVANAKNDIIIGGDAGVTMPEDWLENLLVAFDDDTDIVSGVYKLKGKTPMQKAIADVFQYGLLPDIEKATADFNPSNRSLAYRKKIWKKLGKYPEHMKRSDDTWFNAEARKKGLKFKIAKKAIVYWYARKNLKEVFKYAYLDVKCDVENGLETKRYLKYWIDLLIIIATGIVAIFGIIPLLFYVIMSLNFIYFVYYSIKVAMTNGKMLRVSLYLPVIVTLMASTWAGMLIGLIKK